MKARAYGATEGSKPSGEMSHSALGAGRVDDVIERLAARSRRFQFVAAAICGLANASDAVEVLCLGFVLDHLDGGISDQNKGLLSATVFMGMLVGGLAAGFLGDRFGRKPVLLGSLLVNAAFGAASGALPYWEWLAVCRVIAGVGVGGSVPTLFSLFSEYLPRHNRGMFINFVAAGWMCGSLMVAGTGWIMIGYLHLSWRLFVVATAIPATAAAVLLAWVLPESPRYLFAKGRQVKCVKALEVMAQWNRVGAGEVDIAGAILHEADSGAGAQQHQQPGRGGCVSGGRAFMADFCDARTARRPAILLSVIWFTLSFGWYGFNVWVPSLFSATGLNLDPYQDTFLVAASNLPGNIMAALLIDRVGRRTLLAGSLLAACMCALAFAFSTSSEVAVVTAACLLNAVSVGTWNTLDALSVEHFNTRLRTSAMGVLAAAGRLGSIAGQLTFGALVHVSIVALLSTAAVLLLTGAAAAVALPETTAMDDEQAEAGAAAAAAEADDGEDEDENIPLHLRNFKSLSVTPANLHSISVPKGAAFRREDSDGFSSDSTP